MKLRSFAAALLICFGAAAQEEAGHGVARIGLINGDVSIQRGDNGDWIAAAVNAPLVALDHVATAAGSRAELQFDWANRLRLDSTTEVRLAEIDSASYQIDLVRGVVNLSVLRESPAEVRVNTPSVSVHPLREGSYRIFVNDDGQSEITVRTGEASIDSQAGQEALRPGQMMMARGDASAPEFQVVAAAGSDGWDQWNEQRDRELVRSQSYKYVNRDIYGAEDLDAYGRWVNVAPYGWVWTPAATPGWAPYRAGRWVWVDFYGWTWVGEEPWGWAPYHYGNWFYRPAIGWCWFPGAGPGVVARPVWRPAMVAFIGIGGGGVGVGVGFGHMAWVPLAPHEVYRPWYGAGRTTVVSNVTIVNNYQNVRVVNGVTAVNFNEFGRGRVVAATITTAQLQRATIVQGTVPVAPTRESIRITEREARVPAFARVTTTRQRTFYTPHAPMQVQRVPFEQQRNQAEVISRPAIRPQATPTGSQRTWRQGGTTPAATTPTTAPPARMQPDRGWRRMGDASTGTATQQPPATVNRSEREKRPETKAKEKEKPKDRRSERDAQRQ